VFLQQLGFYFTDRDYSVFMPHIIYELEETYRFIDISLNEANELKFPPAHWQVRSMNNLILNLDASYDTLYRNYNKNTRRNVASARRHYKLSGMAPSCSEIIDTFTDNNKGRYPGIRKINYKRLQALLEKGVEKDLFILRSCYSEKGKLIAAACFLRDFDRYVFFFSANTPEGREKGLMFSIVDDFIRENAGSKMIMDFNGSMDQGVERFYRGFGSAIQAYQRLYINNLPFPLRLFKSPSAKGSSICPRSEK
jgi:hypothetical protein